MCRTGTHLPLISMEKDVTERLIATKVLIAVDRKLSQLGCLGTAFESDFEIVGSGIQTGIAFEISNTGYDWIGSENATFFHDLEMTPTQNFLLRVYLILTRFLFAQYFFEKTQLFTLHG